MIAQILWLISWPVLIGVAYLLVQIALKRFEQGQNQA